MGTKNHRYSAFTLVELLIVLAIVAILAAVAVMYMRGQVFKGNDAKRKADLNRIKIAVEEYEKDHNCYPPPQLLTCNPGTGLQPYIDKIPCDPDTNASYLYDYQNSVCPSWFRFYSNMQFTGDPILTPNIGPNSSFNYVIGSANAPASTQSGGSSGGGGPTATPGGTGEGVPSNQYYGCRSGSCVSISWDDNRPGPECDPSFQNANCYAQCGPPSVECVSWH